MSLFADTGLHVLLGFAIAWGIRSFTNFCGERLQVPTALYLASFGLYFREVTQHQTKHAESFFLTGWNPWSEVYPWGWHKQIETFVPIILLVLFARYLQLRAEAKKKLAVP